MGLPAFKQISNAESDAIFEDDRLESLGLPSSVAEGEMLLRAACRSSNTTGSKRNNSANPLEIDGVITSGGFDMLEGTLYGFWSRDSTRKTVLAELVEAQKETRKNKKNKKGNGKSIVTLPEGDRVAVSAYGFGGGIRCPIAFEVNGIRFGLTLSGDVKGPQVRVFIGSVALMQFGLEQCWQYVLNVLGSIGFYYDRDVVSRADICADLAGVKTEEFAIEFHRGKIVALGRDWALYGTGRKFKGFTIGKGDCLCRVYDKALEVQGDPEKHKVVATRRWGAIEENATRVEFQLRRKKLQEQFGVKSVSDLLEKKALIANYCILKWCRGIIGGRNGNECRQRLSHLWRKVVLAFDSWTGQNEFPFLKPPKRQAIETKGLKAQIKGCLSSYFARLEDEFTGASDMLQMCYELVRDVHKDVFVEWEDKRRIFEITSVIKPPIPTASIPF